MDYEKLQHALMSITIGFAISILTILFQEFIVWLRHFSPAISGGVVGAVVHQIKWKIDTLA